MQNLNLQILYKHIKQDFPSEHHHTLKMSNPTRLLKVRSAEEYSDSFSSFSSSNQSKSDNINGLKKVRKSSQVEDEPRIVIGAIQHNSIQAEDEENLGYLNVIEKVRYCQTVQQTYTPQKICDKSLKNFHGSFSTQREKMELQISPLDTINANLFDAPSKHEASDKRNFDNFDLNQPNEGNKNMQHKLNFKQKRPRGSITYTLPKIPSRMLTYDEQSDKKQRMQDEDPSLIILTKFRSQKIRKSSKLGGQDLLQPAKQQEEIMFYQDQFFKEQASPTLKSKCSISGSLTDQDKMYDQAREDRNLEDFESTETEEEASQFQTIMKEKRKAIRATGKGLTTIFDFRPKIQQLQEQ